MKSAKSKIILSIPLILISLQAFIGALFGYVFTRYLAGRKTGEKSLFKSLAFNLGDWRVHLHHWFVGAGIVLASILFDFYLPFPKFSYGLFGGMIFQGIVDYGDWYKILSRKKNNL